MEDSRDRTINYYEENAKTFIEGTQSVQMTKAWSAFTSLLRPNSLILDLGCGSGRDSKFFLDHGYRVEATDGSEAICKEASAYLHIPVKHQLFTELNECNKYDGVWACSSILHTPKTELRDIINRIYISLKYGGIFYTSFKYGEFEGERNGRYFTDLTEASLRKLLNEGESFILSDMWISSDVRKGREEEKWLNIVAKKI